ncbi:MAG: hypothetical protein COC01_10335 [Bacteroidetes bacterium]|nr:T9SS type A sorting domain-containing protein [Bacteroidia bacterium]PCH65122.1 MAG: hypothetical protein COC01_10335 [Bacteroidota bacterium]
MSFHSSAQTSFEKEFGNSEYGLNGSYIFPLSDGNYLLGGFESTDNQNSNRLFVAKVNQYGDSLWLKYFKKSNSRIDIHGFYETTDGNYLLLNTIYNSNNASDRSHWHLKLSPNGDSLLSKTIVDTNYFTTRTSLNMSDGNYLIAGYSYTSLNLNDILLIKLDLNGNELWRKNYGGTDYENIEGSGAVIEAVNGNLFVASRTYSTSTNTGDLWILYLNSNGDTLWTKNVDVGGTDITNVRKSWIVMNNMIVLVDWYDGSIGENGWSLAKVDSNGNVIWNNKFGGSLDAFYDTDIVSAILRPDGGFLISVNKSYYSTVYNAYTSKPQLIKLNATGDSLWSKDIRYSQGQLINALDGGFYSYGGGVIQRFDKSADSLWANSISHGFTSVNYIVETEDSVVFGVGRGFYSNKIAVIKLERNGKDGCRIFPSNPDYWNPDDPNIYDQPICMVTVDSTTGSFKLVWERNIEYGIDINSSNINIYRQRATGKYQEIGQVPLTDLSTYIDSSSNSYEKSARYKLSILDSCGNESDLSFPHKTMHLLFGEGVNGSWNLIWDIYEGFDFDYYVINRGTSISNMSPIDTVQIDFTTYTDLNPPAGIVYYQIEAINPTGCNATTGKKASITGAKSNYGTNDTTFLKQFMSYPVSAFGVDTTVICKNDTVNFINYSVNANNYSWYFQGGTPNTSNQKNPAVAFSDTGSFDVTLTVTNNNGSANESKPAYINVIDCSQDTTGTGFISNQDMQLFIYPNPSKNILNVEFNASTSEQLNFNLFNIVGEEVLAQKEVSKVGANHFSISTTGLTPGIYFLQLQTLTGKFNSKVAIER